MWSMVVASCCSEMSRFIFRNEEEEKALVFSRTIDCLLHYISLEGRFGGGGCGFYLLLLLVLNSIIIIKNHQFCFLKQKAKKCGDVLCDWIG